MREISKTKWISVEVSLEEFDTDELLDELVLRGYDTTSILNSDKVEPLLNNIYEKYKLKQSYDQQLLELFYITLGRIP
jgi:hypothetical protein